MSLETFIPGSYMTLCNPDEVKRILNVKSGEDYLLKLRANATVEHMRIHRVFRARMMSNNGEWCFNEYFDKAPFTNYTSNLKFADLQESFQIPAGFVFCNRPNGTIIKTEFGNVITISESLKYFLYYMNLTFLSFSDINIPDNVKSASLKIAIRTMLQTEALDFDIDPRGIIPKSVHIELEYHTSKQLEFIIGHEFSHHFLGHLDEKNLIDDSLFSIQSDDFLQKTYSYAQQDEFDADIDAIKRPDFTSEEREDILNRALFFFAYIDIFNDVNEQIFPSGHLPKKHPEPIDRFHNLINEFKDSVNIDMENLEHLLLLKDVYKESLQENVSINIESYEEYGSIYLAEWRGKVLVDRVDF
jgi:hypothetical protein